MPKKLNYALKNNLKSNRLFNYMLLIFNDD